MVDDLDLHSALPSERWKHLSLTLGEFHDRGWRRRVDGASFAIKLGEELRKFIGSPSEFPEQSGVPLSEPILFFSYHPGYAPIADRFERVDHAMQAIGSSEDGFSTFGLGVTLEVSPSATPRYEFHWLVRIDTRNSSVWICELAMLSGRQFNLPVVNRTIDVQPVVVECYKSLLNWLRDCNRTGRPTSLGFDIGRHSYSVTDAIINS